MRSFCHLILHLHLWKCSSKDHNPDERMERRKALIHHVKHFIKQTLQCHYFDLKCSMFWELSKDLYIYNTANEQSMFTFFSCDEEKLCFFSLSVRQLLQALPSRPLSNGYIQQKRLLSSPSSPKKEVLQSIKRYHSTLYWLPAYFKGTMQLLFVVIVVFFNKSDITLLSRKSMSTERLTLVRREMGADSRSRTTSSSSSSGSKRWPSSPVWPNLNKTFNL